MAGLELVLTVDTYLLYKYNLSFVSRRGFWLCPSPAPTLINLDALGEARLGAGSCLESSLACGSQGHRPGLGACVSLSVGEGGGWGLPGAQAKIITREREGAEEEATSREGLSVWLVTCRGHWTSRRVVESVVDAVWSDGWGVEGAGTGTQEMLLRSSGARAGREGST